MQKLKDLLFMIMMISITIAASFYCSVTISDLRVNQKIMADIKGAMDSKDKCDSG